MRNTVPVFLKWVVLYSIFMPRILMQKLQVIIEDAFDNRNKLTPANTPHEIKDAIGQVVSLLDTGEARIAEKLNGEWHVHQWLKKAVLLYFRTHDNEMMSDGPNRHFDKVPLKFHKHTHEEFVSSGVRVVPPATVRRGAYIAPNTILMPSYVNIGAHIDTGTL